MYALCARYGFGPGPAILTAALCVGFVRRAEPLAPRTLALRLFSLPAVALAAAFVGAIVLRAPVAGAALFCACIAVSVWLRNFGARGASIGRVVALPFVTMLAVPVRIDAANPVTAAFLVLLAGACAFAVTTAAGALLRRFGHAPQPAAAEPPRAQREDVLPVATRMALQMLSALALAFAIGLAFFPAHWFWIVLTAFIVCSGAVARGDAIYKGLLRVGGAVAGTFAAALLGFVTFPDPPAYAAAVFFALFLGIWLRQINYAFWAACATLIFALLQGAHGAQAFQLFALRAGCIVIGAACAILATWFVYPVRTGQLVRRRVADALSAMREIVAAPPEQRDRAADVAALDRHSFRLRQTAPPARLHRAIFGRGDAAHPAALLERTHALLTHVRGTEFDRARAGAELRDLAATLRRTAKER